MSAAALRCAAAIRRVGGDAVLVRGEERIFFPASLQPRLSSLSDDVDPRGVGSEDYFTLFTPWDTAGGELTTGDCVEWRDSRYYVCKAETFTLSGEPMYRWAVVRRESTGE